MRRRKLEPLSERFAIKMSVTEKAELMQRAQDKHISAGAIIREAIDLLFEQWDLYDEGAE